MSQKITIVDCGMGNLNSVKRKICIFYPNVTISSNSSDVSMADKIILPGVGHFKNAMENLKKMHLLDTLNNEVICNKKPILGICLGMQLMAKHSEEGNVDGLGWFDAEVLRFKVTDNLKFKIPHIGWNKIALKKTDPLFDNIDLSAEYYFVHSYYIKCNNPTDILNETIYETSFTSAIQYNNIWGVQYHPEKSQDTGLQLLKNFINL